MIMRGVLVCFTHPAIVDHSLDTIKLHVMKTTQLGLALNSEIYQYCTCSKENAIFSFKNFTFKQVQYKNARVVLFFTKQNVSIGNIVFSNPLGWAN